MLMQEFLTEVKSQLPSLSDKIKTNVIKHEYGFMSKFDNYTIGFNTFNSKWYIYYNGYVATEETLIGATEKLNGYFIEKVIA